MDSKSELATVPRFIVFEGVDGVGKFTLSSALARYYRGLSRDAPFYAGAFPGTRPGTLGEWVYRLHHAQLVELSPEQIKPPALQLLHVAAHLDVILSRIEPTLSAGGQVILDRYWWSTYAYSRVHVDQSEAWALVGAEIPFWQSLVRPQVLYLTRRISLKSHEIDQTRHEQLSAFYQEVIERERAVGVVVHELVNDGSVEETWSDLLDALCLPHHAIK